MSIVDACRAHRGPLLADAQRLICHESPSDDRAAIEASADLVTEVVAARFSAAGIEADAERIVIDGCPHIRWRLGSGPRRVLLLAHHDTVWPLGTLQTHPFSLEGGVMRGPGCFDMVVGLAQAVHAIAALADTHGAAAVDGVTLLVTGDEEIGSLTSRELIQTEATGCDAVLVLEAAGPAGALKTARKGVSLYSVDAIGKAAHAGLEPEKGVNAAIEIALQIPRIAALADPAHGTTVTPTRLAADTTVNTVPARARVDVDVRATTAAEQRRVDKAIRSLPPELAGSRIQVGGGINRPVMERASAASLYARAVALAPAAGVECLTEIAVGGASDGNFTAGVGVPTLDGLGAVGGGAHAVDEHVLVEHIVPRTALVALLIQDLLKADAA
ncbi:M20 family metallopeptidase [Demequina sp.]|uniref:M20 family metallopeptidase n=1 Tax=Demequina sp. TaxID=2050685 RepID=UPI0025BC9247|nr:M20 family metallopeptidase [Demequina sp.]